tara:strand:- start:6 stop:521 length:516 start_codon:yes stop_codon:yes gene_type:complete
MTTVTEFDRIVTVDLEQQGKIVGIQLPIGEYPDAGILNDSENLWIVYMLEHNFPEPECKNFDYFRTNYWFNFTDETFVKVESEQPNEYAVYDPTTKTWSWDAALILMDIRRERDGKLVRSDWTQLSDTNLTAEQKAEAVDYRRALRDITINIGNPVTADAVDWPTVPDFLQ